MSVPVRERPLRRDAERNRARIVAAARETFAELGVDAPVEEIARRAGVGVGTVYRRFPGKEDLIDAVLEDALASFVGIAKEALETPDAWEGFCEYVQRGMELNAANRGLHELMSTREHGRERIGAVRAQMRPLVGKLISRAQAEGKLRADFSGADMPLLFMTVGRVIEATGDTAPELWRRFLGLLLDGLRAERATPLPEPPLTWRQVERVGRKRG